MLTQNIAPWQITHASPNQENLFLPAETKVIINLRIILILFTLMTVWWEILWTFGIWDNCSSASFRDLLLILFSLKWYRFDSGMTSPNRSNPSLSATTCAASNPPMTSTTHSLLYSRIMND